MLTINSDRKSGHHGCERGLVTRGWLRVGAVAAILCAVLFLNSAHVAADERIRRVSEALGEHFEETLEGRSLLASDELQAFYRDNRHQPVWTGSAAAAVRLERLLAAIDGSAQHGFNPDRYHRAALASPDTPDLVRELLATDAFLAQANHRVSGVVAPQSLDPDWHLTADEIDAVSGCIAP